jgi:hypothetical protein
MSQCRSGKVRSKPETTIRSSLFTNANNVTMMLLMSKPIPERQGKGSNPNRRAALVRTQFKPGQSGNPGGMPKDTPRVDVAYKKW